MFLDNVSGFLWIHSKPGIYRKAIQSVSNGDYWIPRWLSTKLLVTLRRQIEALRILSPTSGFAATLIWDTLTPRELEIVKLLPQGLSNKEIGRKLGICEDTVKKHLKHIFAKLGIQRRSEIFRFWIKSD